mmetsp:Transcript_10769/g.18397  ORF Transcript_10769/g.18397 Transcript_10769/m.18397 type:complete len:100 (-) Transcript_10769:6-305(-)
MPDSSCISGVHRQSSRSKTIILGKTSLFELYDDADAVAEKPLLPLPMLKEECCVSDACLLPPQKEEQQPTNNAAVEKDKRCSALLVAAIDYWDAILPTI